MTYRFWARKYQACNSIRPITNDSFRPSPAFAYQLLSRIDKVICISVATDERLTVRENDA